MTQSAVKRSSIPQDFDENLYLHQDGGPDTRTAKHMTHAAEVGFLLKQAREELGISIQKIAAQIHVRTLYLEAIEMGELNKLPGDLYTSGFLRLYARTLGLDGDELLRRLSLESRDTHFAERAVYLTSAMEPSRTVVYVSTAIAILSLILVYIVFFTDSPQDIAPQMDTGETEMPSQIIRSVSNQTSEETESTSPSPENKTESVPTTPSSQEASPQATVHEEEKPQQNSQTSALILTASQDCWMEIKRGQTTIFSRILKKGEDFTLDNPEECLLSVGNAGGLMLKQGDNELPPVGKVAQVVRGIALGDYLKQAN